MASSSPRTRLALCPISFNQGLNNFFAATAASIGYFINSEINWLFGYFLPPLPPLPPFIF